MKIRLSGVLPFALIVLLAGVLRFTGLHWGIPTIELPHLPFHPDEQWGMEVLRKVDFVDGRWSPVGNHREGALIPNLWILLALLLKGLGILKKLPYQVSLTDIENARFLYFGRCFDMLLDLGSLGLVALIVKKITRGNTLAILLASLTFAVFPFDVIYGHYLRPHISSNFFALLVVYACLFLVPSEMDKDLKLDSAHCPLVSSSQVRWIGFLLGLAVGARYTSAFLVLLPAFFLISEVFFQSGQLRQWEQPEPSGKGGQMGRPLQERWRAVTALVFHKSFWKIQVQLAVFLLIGFFVAEPALFLQFTRVRDEILFQLSMAPKNEYAGLGLFNFSRVWLYLKVLVPAAAPPALWLLLYFSVIYLLLARPKNKAIYPILFFLIVYFIPMTKWYQSTDFIRPSTLTFPFFSILCGLALSDLFERLRGHKVISGIVAVGVGVIFVSTAFYTAAYVRGMAEEDPQIAVYRNLLAITQSAATPVRVGIFPWPEDYFTLKPSLNLIPSQKLQILEKKEFSQTPAQEVDYVIVGAYSPHDYDVAESRITELVGSGKFERAQIFQTKLSFLGFDFFYNQSPQDLLYPFPTLYLLKAKPSQS